jgi:hypothetical protein
MKSFFTKIFSCLGLAVLLVVFSSKESVAQDFSSLLQANPDDAEVVIGKYLDPAFSAFGHGIANGWYNTAAPHKFPGFDLTVTASLVTIPDESKFFQLTSSTPSISADGDVPTIFGPEGNTQITVDATHQYQGETYTTSATFDAPPSADLAAVPVPIAQLGIGLPKGTDLKIRLLPTIATDEFSMSLWGVGVMHDFKQWIPGLKVAPIDMSILLGYTKFEATVDLSDPDFSDDGQGIIGTSAFTTQVLVSKKLSILTVYGGLGFNSIKSSLKMEGEYHIEGTANGNTQEISLGTDPVDLNMTTGGARATIGLRLKLAILTLHGDYTVQKYNTLTAGVGFSVR